MTAIAAVLAIDRDVRSPLQEIRVRLTPFGGDRSAAWSSHGVGLAVSQRCTLPEDAHDREPALLDGVALAADLRLDNRGDLARSLGIHAAEARALADSALLRRAWLRWGPGCVDHLVGEFAFVVWSAAERLLFAARDPIGSRPLCYARLPQGIALASVPAALAGAAGVSSALDPVRVAQRLAGAPPEPGRTYFDAVSSLPAGHTLIATGDRLEVSRYWTWARTPVRYADPADYVAHFRALFDEAVRARLRSSVPVASLLSGGIDSGAVTATAAIEWPSSGTLEALTWRPRAAAIMGLPPGRIGDESAIAAALVSRYPIVRHTFVDAPDGWVLDALRPIALAGGEPMRSVVNASYFLATSRALRGIHTALLSGQHGNFAASYRGAETFGGWLRSRLRQVTRRSSRTTARGLSAEFAIRHRDRLHDRPVLLDSVEDRRRLLQWNDPGILNAALAAVCGFELRDPTADARLVDFCLAIPDEEHRRGGDRRRLIRRAMRGRVPDATLDATVRGVQGADWPRFISPYREEFSRLLRDVAASPLAGRAIDVPRLRHVLERWPTPRQDTHAQYVDLLVRAMSLGDFIVQCERRAAPGAVN